MATKAQITNPKQPNQTQPRKLKGGLGSTSSPSSSPTGGSFKLQARKLLALDTETTGLDFQHGCQPFFVSTLTAEGQLKYWEWDVNPHTREVQAPASDIQELTTLVKDNDFIFHNAKFDIHALSTHGIPTPDWNKVQDTVIASHVLVSNESHKLKDLALQYLDIEDDDQKLLNDATNQARRYGRQLGWRIANEKDPHFPAQKEPTMGWWLLDTWLPRAVAKYHYELYAEQAKEAATKDAQRAALLGTDSISPRKLPSRANPKRSPKEPTAAEQAYYWRPPGTNGPEDQGHPWWTVLRTYALRDVERTYGLWLSFKEALEAEGLYALYEERRQLLQPIYEMENAGCTINVERARKFMQRLKYDAVRYERRCYKITNDTPPKERLDNLNSPKQLQKLLFGTWKLQPGKSTLTGYSTDAETLEKLLHRSEGPPNEFIQCLRKHRKSNKTLDYAEEYTTRAVPITIPGYSTIVASDLFPIVHEEPVINEWLNLHFSFNITGTDTTRFSSSQPNGQNIGKQVSELGDFNLRRMFGPLPDREWYSVDYSNIELRIFAYESGDENLIRAFEQGYKVHCVFAEALYPKEFHECRREAILALPKDATDLKVWGKAADIFKVRYESTLYQWTKNGTFALIYGAGQERADMTYHLGGAYNTIRQRMPLIDDFLNLKNHEAKTKGYIRCKGGLEANPGYGINLTAKENGYRLNVPLSEPHVAVNYFIQGTAGWCMVRAINRCHRYLASLNQTIHKEQGGLLGSNRSTAPYIPPREAPPNQPPTFVHPVPFNKGEATYRMILTIHDEIVFDFPQHPTNEDTIKRLAKLMEKSGDDIGVPTPVEIERHTNNWAEGIKVTL